MKPSIGRIVHYVYKDRDLSSNAKNFAGRHRPAMIVDVNTDGTVDLQVYVNGFKDGFHHNQSHLWIANVPAGPATHGTWHWPERVD